MCLKTDPVPRHVSVCVCVFTGTCHLLCSFLLLLRRWKIDDGSVLYLLYLSTFSLRAGTATLYSIAIFQNSTNLTTRVITSH